MCRNTLRAYCRDRFQIQARASSIFAARCAQGPVAKRRDLPVARYSWAGQPAHLDPRAKDTTHKLIKPLVGPLSHSLASWRGPRGTWPTHGLGVRRSSGSTGVNEESERSTRGATDAPVPRCVCERFANITQAVRGLSGALIRAGRGLEAGCFGGCRPLRGRAATAHRRLYGPGRGPRSWVERCNGRCLFRPSPSARGCDECGQLMNRELQSGAASRVDLAP